MEKLQGEGGGFSALLESSELVSMFAIAAKLDISTPAEGISTAIDVHGRH